MPGRTKPFEGSKHFSRKFQLFVNKLKDIEPVNENCLKTQQLHLWGFSFQIEKAITVLKGIFFFFLLCS